MAHKGENSDMSHYTRKMRGGNTGVKGRRSREGAGLGKHIKKEYSKMHPPPGKSGMEPVWNYAKKLGRELKNEWFGKGSSMLTSKPASNLIPKGGKEITVWNVDEVRKDRQDRYKYGNQVNKGDPRLPPAEKDQFSGRIAHQFPIFRKKGKEGFGQFQMPTKN